VDSTGIKTYRRNGVGVTSPVLSDGSATYTPGVSQRQSGSSTWDMLNHLGTATLQSNASGTTTATRTYDAFGLMTASTGTPKGPFGFAALHGYQEDGDSGLKLVGHRYYDAYTGRFITRDPIKDGRNWYTYVENNPLGLIDGNGLKAVRPWDKVYDSKDEAARAILEFYVQDSVEHQRETGGWIVQEGTKFRPQKGRTDGFNDRVTLPAQPKGAVASYHTHPFKTHAIGDSSGLVMGDPHDTSHTDRQNARKQKKPVYIMASDRQMLVFDPEVGRTVVVEKK
jgi:RHS repeat-associated protein